MLLISLCQHNTLSGNNKLESGSGDGCCNCKKFPCLMRKDNNGYCLSNWPEMNCSNDFGKADSSFPDVDECNKLLLCLKDDDYIKESPDGARQEICRMARDLYNLYSPISETFTVTNSYGSTTFTTTQTRTKQNTKTLTKYNTISTTLPTPVTTKIETDTDTKTQSPATEYKTSVFCPTVVVPTIVLKKLPKVTYYFIKEKTTQKINKATETHNITETVCPAFFLDSTVKSNQLSFLPKVTHYITSSKTTTQTQNVTETKDKTEKVCPSVTLATEIILTLPRKTFTVTQTVTKKQENTKTSTLNNVKTICPTSTFTNQNTSNIDNLVKKVSNDSLNKCIQGEKENLALTALPTTETTSENFIDKVGIGAVIAGSVAITSILVGGIVLISQKFFSAIEFIN